MELRQRIMKIILLNIVKKHAGGIYIVFSSSALIMKFIVFQKEQSNETFPISSVLFVASSLTTSGGSR